MKFYISFGQVHVHSVNGKTFDKDCLAEITAGSYQEARKVAFDVFKGVFHNCHTEKKMLEVLHYYPRGIIPLEGEAALQTECVVDRDRIQMVLKETFGCKLNGEDCFFERCKKWGECEGLRESLAEAIENGLIIKNKGETNA